MKQVVSREDYKQSRPVGLYDSMYDASCQWIYPVIDTFYPHSLPTQLSSQSASEKLVKKRLGIHGPSPP